MTSAEDSKARRDEFAVSPANGPLPPIYSPSPGQPRPASLLWHAAARAARRAGGWVTRQLLRTTQRTGPDHPRPASGPARQGRARPVR